MQDQEFTEEEIRQRRDAAIRRALNTPPQPRSGPARAPTGGVTTAQDQMCSPAVAAALIPWKKAIAEARKAHLAPPH